MKQPRFKPGDIVVGNDLAAKYSITRPGRRLVVVADDGNTILVNVADECSSDRFVGPWWVESIRFDPEVSPLDPERKLVLRDGRPVDVERTDDPERPFKAKVDGRDLTFDKEGRFYPRINSNFDLVNAP